MTPVGPEGPQWSTAALDHPALASVRPFAEPIARFDRWPSVPELDAALRAHLGDVALEAQEKKKRRRGPLDRASLYVVRIADLGRIPTRERSWHDALNALVWAAFPRSKRALTARQRAILDRRVPEGARTLPGARSREEDALAMLDEGGIVILARDPEVDRAHRAGDASAIDAALRRGDARAHVFGHALMEHAIAGDPDVRGFAVVLEGDDPDRALAAWIERGDELLHPEAWRALPLSVALSIARDEASEPRPPP